MIEGVKKAVMFCAHTDDEMVAAGTLHRLARNGCEVHVVAYGPAAITGDRQGSHPSARVVLEEWHRSLDVIGVGHEPNVAPHGPAPPSGYRHYLGYVPSSKLDDYKQGIADFAFKLVEHVKPDAVFTLSPDDENPAHSVVGTQTERVLRGRVPLTIRCNYSWNYTVGRPNLFVRLDPEDVAAKRAVINCYQSQLWRYKYEDLMLAAAVTDGLSVKVSYAEKFEIIRSVV